MTSRRESIVLVEGFDDRDFWRGLLLRAGCSEARGGPPAHHRAAAAFTYLTPRDSLIHVVPFKVPRPGGQRGDLAEVVDLKLREIAHKPIHRLVLSPDADAYPTLDDARRSALGMLARASFQVTDAVSGDLEADGREQGKVIVSVLVVHAGTASSGDGQIPAGVPTQPALEQLACAALCKANPERGRAVASWLSSRPQPAGKEHKAHAWSFYAGWGTQHGTGDFYGSLWREETIAAELERILRQQGAWRIIEALLEA